MSHSRPDVSVVDFFFSFFSNVLTKVCMTIDFGSHSWLKHGLIFIQIGTKLVAKMLFFGNQRTFWPLDEINQSAHFSHSSLEWKSRAYLARFLMLYNYTGWLAELGKYYAMKVSTNKPVTLWSCLLRFHTKWTFRIVCRELIQTANGSSPYHPWTDQRFLKIQSFCEKNIPSLIPQS